MRLCFFTKVFYSIYIVILVVYLGLAQTTPGGPVIGVVTMPSDINGYSSDLWSYVPASYIKFVESGGAQVVPIPYDIPQLKLAYLLARLNGVMFTGGDSAFLQNEEKLTPFASTLQFIINYIIEQNNQGTYYPLWGTCLGFEAIACILAQNFTIRGQCVGCENVCKNNFINTNYSSRMLANLDPDLVIKISTANLTYFAQSYMVGTNLFQTNNSLSQIMTPVTFTYDQDQNEYVSSFESPSLPIYGTQFHPEKSTYEWHSSSTYNHGIDAVRLQQYLSNFFINEARKNNNTFPNVAEFSVDNYQEQVVPASGYTAIYFFPSNSKSQNASKIYNSVAAMLLIILSSLLF